MIKQKKCRESQYMCVCGGRGAKKFIQKWNSDPHISNPRLRNVSSLLCIGLQNPSWLLSWKSLRGNCQMLSDTVRVRWKIILWVVCFQGWKEQSELKSNFLESFSWEGIEIFRLYTLQNKKSLPWLKQVPLWDQ